MTKEKILILIIVVMTLISIIVPNILRKKYQDRFINLFQQKKFDELETLLAKKTVKYLFMPFNIEYMRLNIAFMKGDEDAINKQFSLFAKMPMNKKQKEDIYIKAFNYYVTMEDIERAKKAYELVQSLKDEKIKKSADITYDIFCEKGYKYLDELEKGMESCPADLKSYNAYLVSLMYANKGDQKKAEKYKEMAKSFLPNNKEEKNDNNN
ncbi:MAG: hypothetical protein Q4C64_01910 [Erysipelotrichia bacterium]|nr:hypothetical protein [Erysipelotrichia bacterium]